MQGLTRRPEGVELNHINTASGLLTCVARDLERLVALFDDDPGWQGKRGGYFCLADGETGLPLLLACIGEVPDEKVERYLRLCQEKPRRLAKYAPHVSSWMSRNPEADEWGGAIRITSNMIFSFSGLPELGDEVLMLALGHEFLKDTIDEPGYPYGVIWEIADESLEKYALWNKFYSAYLVG